MKFGRTHLVLLALVCTDGVSAKRGNRRFRSKGSLLTTLHNNNDNIHVALNKIRGGGVVLKATESESTATSSSTKIPRLKKQTLNTLHQTSFLMVSSTSMVVFAPLPSLTKHIADTMDATSSTPQERAIQILAIISAISAAIELFLSPLVGVIIDIFGRKLPMVVFASLIGCANLGVVLYPCIITICLSRIVNVLVGGFLVIIVNAIIADVFTTSNDNNDNNGSEMMGSVLGRQAATVSLGFLLGSVVGGRLTEYSERTAYTGALILSTLATLNVAFRMVDSLQFTKDAKTQDGRNGNILTRISGKKEEEDTSTTNTDAYNVGAQLCNKLIEAPLSAVKLLYSYGSQMRTLAILLMLQSLPIYMGDTFQLFSKEEWNLNPKDFANIVGTYKQNTTTANTFVVFFLHILVCSLTLFFFSQHSTSWYVVV